MPADQVVKLSGVQKGKENLCEIDLKKYNSFISKRDQTLFIAARMLLGFIFRENHISFSPEDLHYSQFGQPLYSPPYHISIAHSGSYCAVAVSDCGPVGIDIQEIRNIEIQDYEFVLSSEEREFFRHQKKEEQMKFFFQKWCELEAVMKADGRGFHLSPEVIKKKGERYEVTDNNKNYFRNMVPGIHNYGLALVSSVKDEPVRWVFPVEGLK